MNSNLPRQPAQQHGAIESLNNERNSNQEKQKGNRKRDFSMVVDNENRRIKNSQTIDANNSQSTAASKYDQQKD